MLALSGTDTMSLKMTWSVPGHQRWDTPSMSAGCLAARKKQKKSGQHRRGVSWRLRYTVPIDEQIRAQELHSQSLSPKKKTVVFLCQARNVRQNRPRCHLHPCLHRSAQTLQFSDCTICRHQEKKVRPLPKFGEHRKRTPRSEQCAHLSSRVQVCHE